MSDFLRQFLVGVLLAILVALAAYRLRTLSRSGAAAAGVLGVIFFGLGGWDWSVLLLAFFVSSSGLSRLAKKRKAVLDEKFSKGSQRDAWQVLANGGIAGVFVLLHLAFPGSAWPWAGCAGALAAANADTWATELGVLGRAAPRLITNGKRVERGTSGGVSLAGGAAALGGALLVGLCAAAFWPGGGGNAVQTLARLAGLSAAGLAGSLVDSWLGASLQAIYTCPACRKETEKHPLHSCGTPTTLIRGLAWLDNDWVNTACTLAGGLLAVMLFL